MDGDFFRVAEVGISVGYIILPFVLGYAHALIKGGGKWDMIFLYYLFVGVGVQGIVTGIAQIAIPETISENLEWANSPFLLELGMANISFGAVGIVGPWINRGWSTAAAVAYSLFLTITGLGHLVELLQYGPSPGNSGGFLYSDLLVPVFTLAFMMLSRKQVYSSIEVRA